MSKQIHSKSTAWQSDFIVYELHIDWLTGFFDGLHWMTGRGWAIVSFTIEVFVDLIRGDSISRTIENELRFHIKTLKIYMLLP